MTGLAAARACSVPPLLLHPLPLYSQWGLLSTQLVTCCRQDRAALMIWISRSVYNPNASDWWKLHSKSTDTCCFTCEQHISSPLLYQRHIQSPLNLFGSYVVVLDCFIRQDNILTNHPGSHYRLVALFLLLRKIVSKCLSLSDSPTLWFFSPKIWHKFAIFDVCSLSRMVYIFLFDYFNLMTITGQWTGHMTMYITAADM